MPLNLSDKPSIYLLALSLTFSLFSAWANAVSVPVNVLVIDAIRCLAPFSILRSCSTEAKPADSRKIISSPFERPKTHNFIKKNTIRAIHTPFRPKPKLRSLRWVFWRKEFSNHYIFLELNVQVRNRTAILDLLRNFFGFTFQKICPSRILWLKDLGKR